MILTLEVKNYRGIKEKYTISSLASNKIKRNNSNTCINLDEHKILKNICIIGANASGKSSLINSINTIKSFINFPFRRIMNSDNEFKKYIDSLSPEKLKKFLENFNTLSLGEPYKLSSEPTEIKIELYIPNREKNIPGIYEYYIMYDKNYKQTGILKEKLTYRKKYSSRKITLLSEVENIIESEISSYVLYKNNSFKSSKYIDYFESFTDEVTKHIRVDFSGMDYDLMEKLASKNQKNFLKLCQAADKNIMDISIKKNEITKENDILFWISNKNYIEFDDLSDGTKLTLLLGSNIIDIINNNDTFVYDEIETSLHPSLARFLISLNEQKETYSQIIFSTHSPILSLYLNNDQIYFISGKDKKEICNISTAITKKKITKDQSLLKAWLEGMIIDNPTFEEEHNFFE